MQKSLPLTWLNPGDAFPGADRAWPAGSRAPGLLAAGGALDTPTLLGAYRQGVFPWFSEGEPILWWCPHPRMVLDIAAFRLHRSLRNTLQQFQDDARCEVHMDRSFDHVIAACAGSVRRGQDGTWIVPAMVEAYRELHRAGHAHSVETWIDGQLVGGLYCVNIGGAVFGESMFTTRTDASKIALAALVAWCLEHGVQWIDCQQNTRHLASLGAKEIARTAFLQRVGSAAQRAAPRWRFEPLYWNHLLTTRQLASD